MNYVISYLKPFGVMIKSKNAHNNIENIDIDILLRLYNKHQIVILRGFKTKDFISYCENWGKISIWPFGKMLNLVKQVDPKDHIFDNSYMPLHWDGMYRKEVPEYQIFHCVKAPLKNQGGRTIFSNTILALESISEELKILCNKVIVSYHRAMEFYDSKIKAPIIAKHPFKNYDVIRYNEPYSEDKGKFINSPEIKFSGIDKSKIYEFCNQLNNVLYSTNNLYAHEWQDHDVVIADNFSLLHGREKFVSQSSRHIQRVHVLSSPVFTNPYLESFK